MALADIIQQFMALRGGSPAQFLGNMGQAMGMPQPPWQQGQPMNILPPAAQAQMPALPQRPMDPMAMQLAMQGAQPPQMQMPQRPMMPQMPGQFQRPMMPPQWGQNRGPWR